MRPKPSARLDTFTTRATFMDGSVPAQHELAVKLLEQHQVRVEPLISHRFPLSKINEAFAAMEERRGMKVVIHPHPAS